jgi:hypothetical protein
MLSPFVRNSHSGPIAALGTKPLDEAPRFKAFASPTEGRLRRTITTKANLSCRKSLHAWRLKISMFLAAFPRIRHRQYQAIARRWELEPFVQNLGMVDAVLPTCLFQNEPLQR